MSTTAIDFPANRSQLDPSLNSPPYTDIPLENGDTFIASGSSYTWAQDETEAYGRWKNEDPGATSDARYVKKEDEGATQVINGGGTLSINDNIELHGGDGSGEFAGSVSFGDPFSSTPADKKGIYAFTPGAVSIFHNDRASLNCLAITDTLTDTEVFSVNGAGGATFAGTIYARPGITTGPFAAMGSTGVGCFNGTKNTFNVTTDGYFRLGDDITTPNITLIGSTGAAKFVGGLAGIDAAGSFYTNGATGSDVIFDGRVFNGTSAVSMTAGGVATFALQASAGTAAQGTFINAQGNNRIAVNTSGAGTVFQVDNDGAGTFKGDVIVGSNYGTGTGCQMFEKGLITLRRDDDSKIVFEAFSGGSATSNRVIQLGASGTATFKGPIYSRAGMTTGPSASMGSTGFGCFNGTKNTFNVTTDGYTRIGNDITTPAIEFVANGNAFFQGTVRATVVAPNLFINLEADDDTKYTTTTETYTEPQTLTGPLGNEITMDVEKTREVRTYIGAVMDVKEVIQSLVTRCDSRDAQIAALTARISQLELPGTPEPTPEPTPVVPHNLIPDTWSQEQRMAAMSELLQEYQANRD